MATLDIKFSKFDNRPWGFRLAGGSDFPEPLTVIRVSEGSLAECMGLKVGDVIVKLNDQPIREMTHGQAHEALTLAGNNFVLGVRRTEDPSKAIEGIEEKIEPYMLPIEEILFASAEEEREATPDEVPRIEEESAPTEDKPEVEEYPEKPRDINSDPLPKTDLTEEEIAQLILDEEEVLNDKGVLGVNFKKIRPRAPLLKKSEVFRELQNEIAAEPEEVQERKRQSTFLRKPERPAPTPKVTQEDNEPEVEPYRVVIKKQPKRPITERLLQKGLLDPSRAKTPDSVTSIITADTTSEVNEYTCTDTWSYTSYLIDTSDSELSEPDMLPISEGIEETSPPATASFNQEVAQLEPQAEPEPRQPETEPVREESFVVEKMIIPKQLMEEPAAQFIVPRGSAKKQRLCRRGRYAKRCLNRALDSLKSSPKSKTKPRLLRRAHYFERIVNDVKNSIGGAQEKRTCSEEQSLLNVLMLASLACSLRDAYDTEILHRGSSRRNSRRMSSCRRDSSALPLYEPNGSFFSFSRKNSLQGDSLKSFQIRCAEGRRRLSVMSMMVADKVSNAMRTDLARGLAYAMVPCASALAFFMFNYAKRYNNNAEHRE